MSIPNVRDTADFAGVGWPIEGPNLDRQRSQPSDCESCGAAGVGGRAGCQSLLDELMARAHSDVRYAVAYRLAFDAYCMQHPEEYCVSAKSYAAHLMGLCHGIERADWPQRYWGIPRWLNGPSQLQKPPLLSARGALTIADVPAADAPDQHTQKVRAWAESVWRAYESQHALARQWLRQALGEEP